VRIGILGSRGIPNNYGGFEQFAEHLSFGLVQLGHEVSVYNSHNHPYKERLWRGVNLIHCHDPENYLGIAGQFVYDLICILDSRKRSFDILLQLGYTSSSIWRRFLPGNSKIVTNMDGLEWKRSKYHKPVRTFLKYAENLAVKSSSLLISDSEVMREYLIRMYQVKPVYIPYGAYVSETQNAAGLIPFHVRPQNYFLLISRIQSDNHVEEIIKGVLQSGSSMPLLIIGNIKNRYGKRLEKHYSSEKIRFLGPCFEKKTLDLLRFFSKLYFHGHSSGGTNPSLLEAMAASAPICAHDNPFNHEVLGQDAFYFTDSGQISEMICGFIDPQVTKSFILNNIQKIQTRYRWNAVISAYNHVFEELIKITGPNQSFNLNNHGNKQNNRFYL